MALNLVLHGREWGPDTDPRLNLGALRTLAQVLKAVCSLGRWHSDPVPEMEGQQALCPAALACISTSYHEAKLLVSLSEDSEVREKSHVQGQLVFVF